MEDTFKKNILNLTLVLILCFSASAVDPGELCSLNITGATGAVKTAILSRYGCIQSTTGYDFCSTEFNKLEKGRLYTPATNHTRHIRVKFFGKDVCLAYLFKKYYHRSFSGLSLDYSECRQICFNKFQYRVVEETIDYLNDYGNSYREQDYYSTYEVIIKPSSGKQPALISNICYTTVMVMLSIILFLI